MIPNDLPCSFLTGQKNNVATHETATAKILVVDDEPIVGNVICDWLNVDGYEAECITCGEEALKLIKERPFDLLISDIAMPVLSGLELLKLVRTIRPELAVVMATGVDDRETASKALELGADGYVIKPYKMNEFLINIGNILEKKRLAIESSRCNEMLEEKVRERTAKLRKREEEIALRLITATGFRDDETGEHIKRMGLYSVVMAQALGWEQEKIDMIKVAAPMHDVGKIGLPDHVLQKRGRLSPEEQCVIREHPRMGAAILGGSNIPLLQMAEDIALYHHERWDGSGYPSGLHGDDIPEAARIVAVVDVYDALCHNRVYRAAYNESDTLAIMRKKRGRHFSPEIYDCFMDILPCIRKIRNECELNLD